MDSLEKIYSDLSTVCKTITRSEEHVELLRELIERAFELGKNSIEPYIQWHLIDEDPPKEEAAYILHGHFFTNPSKSWTGIHFFDEYYGFDDLSNNAAVTHWASVPVPRTGKACYINLDNPSAKISWIDGQTLCIDGILYKQSFDAMKITDMRDIGDTVECSACHAWIDLQGISVNADNAFELNFCPECGAKFTDAISAPEFYGQDYGMNPHVFEAKKKCLRKKARR